MKKRSIFIFLLVLGFFCKICLQVVLAMPVADASPSKKAMLAVPLVGETNENRYKDAADDDISHISGSGQSSKIEGQPVSASVDKKLCYKRLCTLPQELVVQIFKYAYREMTPDRQSVIVEYLYQNPVFQNSKKLKDNKTRVFGFTGLEVMEILGDTSEQMLLLMTYIVNDKSDTREDNSVDKYRSIFRESPHLIFQTDARNKNCVHYALAMLSTCHAAAAGRFLNYILAQKELRKILPVDLPDFEGNLPIHVIANQLKILEGLKMSAIQRSNYAAALAIAKKIAGWQPNFLDSTNWQRQTPFDLLKLSKDPESLNALLCDDFDLSEKVAKQLREIEKEFLGKPLLADFHKRRAEKIQQVEQFYILLKKTPPMALDSTIKSSLQLLNTQDGHEHSMVARSLRENQMAIFRVLLENGAEASSAIVFACLRDKPEAVKVLIDSGLEINEPCDSMGMTALHLAVRFDGSLELVRVLIAAGADVNLPDVNGWSVLHYAADCDHTEELVKVLIAAGANVDLQEYDGMTSLHLAAKSDTTEELVKVLIAVGANLNLTDDVGWSALHYAAHNGRLPVVQALIAAGADVKIRCSEGKTAFDMALCKGYARLGLKLLCAAPELLEVDKWDLFLLLVNSEAGILQEERLRAQTRVYVNKRWHDDGMTALQIAAENGHLEVVKRLLDDGAVVNMEDEQGLTSLHYAAKNGHLEVVKSLLDAGAEVNRKDNQGETALDYALNSGQEEVGLVLIEAGAE